MRGHCDGSYSIRHQRREAPRHPALRWFASVFPVLCFWLSIFALAPLAKSFLLPVESFAKEQPSVADRLPGANQALIVKRQPGAPIPLQPQTETETDPAAGSANEAKDPDSNAEWCLVLVNKWNPIPEDYDVDLMELANGQFVDVRIYPALQNMFDAARSEGVYPVVAAGYRTAQKQQSLLDEKIAAYKAKGYSAEEAKTRAEAWVATPEHSEHRLGIAVDINADGIHSAGHEVYGWLGRNAHRFGFICRYPPDKTEITGVADEPWHYRYVGVDAAIEMHDRGICLEEYLGAL